MKTLNRCCFLLLSGLLFLQTFPMPILAKAPAQKRVRVYLSKPTQGSESNPLGIVRVYRRVSAVTPARGALNAVLAGPTAAERRAGFSGVEGNELRIGSLGINRGTARVNFVSSGPKRWNGDLSAPRFRKAVERTLLQFPTVQRVRVQVNGNPNFDSLKG